MPKGAKGSTSFSELPFPLGFSTTFTTLFLHTSAQLQQSYSMYLTETRLPHETIVTSTWILHFFISSYCYGSRQHHNMFPSPEPNRRPSKSVCLSVSHHEDKSGSRESFGLGGSKENVRILYPNMKSLF